MKDVLASRLLQAVSITCNSFTLNATLPSHCSCVSLFIITLISWAETPWQEQHLQESCCSDFKGSLANRCWKGLKGKLQLQHLSLESCSPHRAQDWPCLPGHADTVLPRKPQENCWGMDTPRIQFPFPWIFYLQSQTLPNLSHPHCPQSQADTHRPWWGLPAPGRAVTHPSWQWAHSKSHLQSYSAASAVKSLQPRATTCQHLPARLLFPGCSLIKQ